MKKKAQGISVNVIIIAAIALLLLVILSVIFIGNLGQFGAGVAECENKGGKCADPGVDCGDADTDVETYPTQYSAWSCTTEDDEARKCCIQVTA